MLASLFVQRTNSSRKAIAIIGAGALAGMCAITVPFLLTQTEPPTALVLIGRWIPAAASLLALRLTRPEGGGLDWWQLRPGGWRKLLAGIGSAVGISGGIAAAGYGISRLAGFTGATTLPSAAELVMIALMTTVVASVSTLGEEVAWRAHLRKLTRPHGFWASALGVSAFWALWHLPLHASYVLAGAMPLNIAAASTVALIGVGPLWAALVERFGSVWPAVVAHAFPLTPLVLAGNLGEAAPWKVWAVAATWAVLNLAVTAVVKPRDDRDAPTG